MKFLIGEDGWSWLERAVYRGGIGLYYDSTIGGVITYVVFALVCIFAIIGLFATIKWLFTGHKKKDPGQEWLHNGKY